MSYDGYEMIGIHVRTVVGWWHGYSIACEGSACEPVAKRRVMRKSPHQLRKYET